MGVFDPVELVWEGKTYTVPANRVLGMIARIEEVVTLQELRVFSERHASPLAHMSQAYAAALTYAGCRVDADDVYYAVTRGGDVTIAERVSEILLLMIPPNREDAHAPAPLDGSPKVGALSSRKPTKPRLPAENGSAPPSSGD